MSRKLQLEIVASDSLVANDFTPFSPLLTSRGRHNDSEFPFNIPPAVPEETETEPLLGGAKPKKKPFYRARPLWIVPFAILAAVTRGMTLAARVEVFTQLSCDAVHGNQSYTGADPGSDDNNNNPLLPLLNLNTSRSSASPISYFFASPPPKDEIPFPPPPRQCSSDPIVQQGVAKLQVILTTIMGLLSAVTNGFWGGFGEKYGRTRVLALVSLGLFFTDMCFVLTASRSPSSPLSTPSFLNTHPTSLLILAHITEGLLGGWTALQSATSAYISDCTSPGSKATIFARFTGVFYMGFTIGPLIGARLIRMAATSNNVLQSSSSRCSASLCIDADCARQPC